jgi:hypothetical protein
MGIAGCDPADVRDRATAVVVVAALLMHAQQIEQLGDVGRNAPRPIAPRQGSTRLPRINQE